MKKLILLLLIFVNVGIRAEINNSYKNNGTEVYSPGAVTPRRVKGYTAEGDSIDTGNDTKGNPRYMWEDEYSYYYDGNYWYRTNGRTWECWNGFDIWGFEILYNWYGTRPPENATQYYKENPLPINEDLILLFLVLSYLLIKRYRWFELVTRRTRAIKQRLVL